MNLVHSNRIWFFNLFFFLGLILILNSGCSGGGSGDAEVKSTPAISGLVQKGLYIDGEISAQRVDSNGSIDAKTIIVNISDKGEYTLSPSWEGLTLLSAEGHFFNEYSGVNSDEVVTLYALINITQNQSATININMLTSLEANRILFLMQNGDSYAEAYTQAKASLQKVFGLAEDVNAYDLDIFDVNSSLKDENQNLLLLSATFLKITQQAKKTATPSPALKLAIPRKSGKFGPMDKFSEDYSKDGAVDGMFKEEWGQMIEDDANKTLKRADSNLQLGDREYKVPERNWAQRLRLSISDPSYLYSGGSLVSVTYTITLPSTNFLNRVASYSVDYSTVDDTAIAGTEYTQTTGTLLFSLRSNSHSITIPITHQSATQKEFKLHFSEDYDRLVISNPNQEIIIPATSSAVISDLDIQALNLREVHINGYSATVSSQDAFILIGSNSSSTSLDILFTSRSYSPANYFADIYVTTEGQADLLIKEAAYIPTVYSWYWYTQIANINIPIDSTLKTYLKTAYDNDRTVKLKAIAHVGENSTVEKDSSTLPRLVQISQNMQPNTTITTLDYISSVNSSCANNHADVDFTQAIQYALVDIEATYAPKGTGQEIGANYNNVCVKLTYDESDNEFDVTLEQGSAQLDESIIANIYAQEVEIDVSGISKDRINVSSIHLNLPAEHSIHRKNIDGSLSPRGQTYINLKVRNFLHDDDLTEQLFSDTFVTDYYLHAKHLPFSFHLKDYTLNEDGLSLHSKGIKYVFDYANQTINNTALFNSPDNSTIALSLDTNGISSQSLIKFIESSAELNYPRATTQTEDFAVSVNRSKIQTASSSLNSSFSLKYLQNCNGSECSGNAQRKEISVDTKEITIYSDGSYIAQTDEPLGEISWGEKNSDVVFVRNEDIGARVFVPGFELPTNNPRKIGNYLFGTAKKETSSLSYHSTLTADTILGRYLFAGINLGNFEDTALNTLLDKQMSISVGKGVELITTSNDATKYYIRPSGITGVFNNQEKSLSTTIYGYPMSFSSFKFRQTNNILDHYTKINGLLEVIGKGAFDVNFTNLEMDCTGNLGSGHIAQEQGETILDAWKVASTLTTMDFVNTENKICSNDKGLSLGHIVKVAALKDKIGINTFWNSDGFPFNTKILSSTYNQLDGNSSLDDEQDNGGFDIALEGLTLKSSHTSGTGGKNWIETDAAFGLPFWGLNDMSVRMVNSTKTTRAPSVVTKKGELFTDGRRKTSSNLALANSIAADYKHNISQSWFGIMNFGLPVYYNATSDISLAPTFLGRTLSSDLIVLKADAGINYVTPEATAMSFGASANFAALKGLKLHVDLSDPKSLEEIDNSLHTYLDIDRALQDTIGVLLENIKIGNKLLKEGMTLAMEEGAYYALREAGGGADDPFEIIANANAELYALPVVLRDRFQEIFEGQIRTAIATNRDDVEALRAALDEPIAQYYSFLAYLNTIEAKLAAIPSAADTLANMKNFIYDNGFGGRTCNWNTFTTQGFFAPVGRANSAIANVNSRLQSMNISKIEDIARKANQFTGLNSRDLVSTAQKVKDLTDDLDDLVNDFNSSVITYFNGTVCDGLDTGMDTLDSVYARISPVDGFITSIENNVSEIKVLLQDPAILEIIATIESINVDTNLTELEDSITREISGPILAKIDPLVEEIQNNIPNISSDDLRRLLVTKIFQFEVVSKLNQKLLVELTPVADELNKLAMQVFSGFDKSINKLLANVNDAVNKLLAKATSALDKIPLATASMDGYAVFYGDSLSKLHVGSEFAVTGKDKESSFGFNAALDIENDENNDEVGCKNAGGTSNLRAAISTRDLSMPLGEKELKVDLILLGVTIGSDASVKGIFGAITSKSGFNYDTFKLYDLGLATGIGVEETYLGAKASATMDDLQLGVSFLVGQVCNRMIVKSVIPEAINEFITIPNNRFNGGLVFGEGQMPIWVNGCTLTVNARAKLGTWFIFGPPKTYGGIVGGGAFGKALCIATLGGEVEILAEKSGDVVRFQGTGWGAAGVGSCDNSWSSVRDSRRDSWCGTGDARFGALYNDGWELLDIRTSAVH